ncbi:MAG: VIT domain-containing protein [Spirochaetia bacterium]
MHNAIRVVTLPSYARRAVWLAALLAAVALPGICAADGLIVIDDPPQAPAGHFSFAPLEVSYHHVAVAVTELVAVTTVDEEFYNPNRERLEGTYIFPLPQGAHIDRFSMDIAGKMMDAELLPADKARAFYEDVVRRMKDPALLEYVGRGAFKLRVYPIEPMSGKRVRITYSELLKNDGGMVQYTYPLNTEKFSAAAVKDVSVKVTLDGREQLKSVYCPSHPAEIRRDGERRAVVGWEGRNVWPDTDFTVIFSRTPNPLGIDLVTSRPRAGEDGYFMLLASPGEAPTANVQPKDICFVLDTSGSMAGQKLEQAKKALRFCLANLGADDRFEIVRFSTETEPLFGSLVRADPARIAQASSFVDGLRANGGTAIQDALARATALRPPGSGEESSRPYTVIFLTDGLPTVGETGEDPLVDSVRAAGASTRIFTFGIGTDVNTHLLDRIASETRAASQYVLPQEDIEVKVSSFYSKIRDPVLTNLAVAFTNPSIRVTQLQPSTMPDLFNGDMLVVLGRYSGAGAAAVKISGTVGGKTRTFAADVSFPAETTGDSFVPQLWATRRVGWLLDEMRMHGESAELKDEVIRLSRDFGIVTPYTAYLVLEDEARRAVPVNLRSYQEMEKDLDATDNAKARLDSVRKEAASEASRAGESAVENSMAMQGLMSVTTVPQAAPAAGLEKRDAPPLTRGAGGYRAAQQQNYAQQVRVVNGRAFYQNGNVWTDSSAQLRPGLAQRQVRFGSTEYFELLKKSPAAAQWLALGSNVDVVVDGVLVSVRE